MTNAIRIHSFPLSGHSHRVRLLANLAGIAHEVIHVDLPGGEHKNEPFLALNPLGQVPVIEDGEIVVYDSLAILVYLARRYAPDYLPNDPVDEAEVQRFLAIAAGELSFGPGMARLIKIFNAPYDAEFCKATAEKVFTKIDTHMQGREFLVGNSPTIADIALYSYSAHAPEGGISLSAYPDLQRLLKNVEALDGFVPMQATETA